MTRWGMPAFLRSPFPCSNPAFQCTCSLDSPLHHVVQGPKQQDGEQDADAAADPLMYGPKPDQLIPKAGAALGGDTPASGVYRPPKLNPVAMQDDPDK